MSEQDVRAATEAGMAACEQRQSHYMANVSGQAATAGDPARPQEEPTLEPVPGPPMQSTV